MIKLNNQKILSALATSLFLVSFSPTIAEDYNETKTAQTTLKNLGYSVGSVDGILGAKTLDAITKFCQTEKPKCNPNNIEEVLALLNKPSEITQKPKKRSRLGSIDLDGRMAELSKKPYLLRNKCTPYKFNSTAELEIIKTLEPKAGYGGSDPRIQPVSNKLIDFTAACFGGNQVACQTGIASLKKYAALDAPLENQKAKSSRELRVANDYIMNTSFISPAINFLSAYNREVGLTDSELAVFDKWLKNITERYRKEGFNSNDRPEASKHGHNERWATQNHFISSNISSAALGTWLGDPKLLSYGAKQWKVTLGTMRSDGSLPHETARGSRAILYSGYSITKLVRLAEIFRQQGVDLYSTEVKGKSIHDNVSFYLDVMQRPEIIHKYAKYDVNSGGDIDYKDQEELGMYSGHHAWITPYMLRFPNHPNTLRLKKFTGNENKHTKNLVAVIKQGYGGTYGLDADSRCFYSKI